MHAEPVHAYALRGRAGLLCLRSQLPLISTEAPTAWVHLAYEGAWEGHADGPFELTHGDFRAAIRNIEAQKNPVPLDFDHESEFMPPPWPARGWIHELETRDGEDGKAHLWALIEFGPRAVKFNREGGYRFCSAVFDFGARDRATNEPIGMRLKSVGLTDQPFIDGQQPIRLSQRAASALGDNMKKTQILALMAISKESLAAALDQIEGDEISPEQLEAAAQFAAAKDGQVDEPAEEPPLMEEPAEEPALADGGEEEDEAKEPALADEPHAEEQPEEAQAMAVLAPLMEQTGFDLSQLSAALSENMDAVSAALTGALDQPAAPAPLSEGAGDVAALQLSDAQGKVKQLSDSNKRMSAELERFRGEEADRLVKALCDSGRILVGDSDKWRKLCLSARETFDALTPTLPQVVPMGGHATSIDAPAPDAEPPLDESNEFVKRTRLSMKRAGITDVKTQDRKIREGLKRLNARSATGAV